MYVYVYIYIRYKHRCLVRQCVQICVSAPYTPTHANTCTTYMQDPIRVSLHYEEYTMYHMNIINTNIINMA